MINQTKALKLIKIYSLLCDRFEKDLKYTCERLSHNQKQDITNQEIMVIYLNVFLNSDLILLFLIDEIN
jgi:hypothetical protein